MAIVPMKALLESGVHFGHRTHKWHPLMKPYIFTERNSIHIIDLQKTVKALEEAYNLVRDTVSDGGTVLFVGTKRQAQETIQNEATRCGMPYVTIRWLGGMLTNWRTIRQRINELDRLERMRDRGDFERLTKKEGLILTRQIERLEMLLGGIRHMNGLPDILFAVDVRREDTAIHEANLLEIPVVAMVDTNCDPRNIDYVIPSNDDAIRAIKLLVGKIADAVMEGKAMRKEEEELAAAEMIEGGRPPMEEEEEELSDEELLGEATLAKISKASAAEEEEVEEEQAAEEEEQAEEEEAEEQEEAEEEEVEEAPPTKAEAEEPKVEAAEEAAEEQEAEETSAEAEAEEEPVEEADEEEEEADEEDEDDDEEDEDDDEEDEDEDDEEEEEEEDEDKE